MMEKPGNTLFMVFMAAGVPFYFGILMGFNKALQRFAFEVGAFFLILAFLATLIVITLNDERKFVRVLNIIFFGLLFISLFTMILFIHDRQENLPEDFCQQLNDGWSYERIVALDRGMCLKNETGLHATGKALFPDRMFPIIDY